MQKRTDVNVEQANAQKQTPGGVLGKRGVQSSRTQTIVDKKISLISLPSVPLNINIP